MAVQTYKEVNFRGKQLVLVYIIADIIAAYQKQGLRLSVRQVYYQLVARGHIPNTSQSYERVSRIVNDARLGGYLDWDAIEDRNRDVIVRPRWDSGASIVRACAEGFHMDLWDNQEHRLFVIVEKAALAGVLESICEAYDVPFLAARGYPSVSIVREMALEHIAPAINAGQYVTVLHLGDHDPSGIDMTRDLTERFGLFLEPECGDAELDAFALERIALTMDQIRETDPPPNPAKTTDSRFVDYMMKHGNESWELDALEPAYLRALVTRHIESYIDWDNWEARKAEIEKVRARLQKTAQRFAKEGV
jgi:hypothetical protein